MNWYRRAQEDLLEDILEEVSSPVRYEEDGKFILHIRGLGMLFSSFGLPLKNWDMWSSREITLSFGAAPKGMEGGEDLEAVYNFLHGIRGVHSITSGYDNDDRYFIVRFEGPVDVDGDWLP